MWPHLARKFIRQNWVNKFNLIAIIKASNIEVKKILRVNEIIFFYEKFRLILFPLGMNICLGFFIEENCQC